MNAHLRPRGSAWPQIGLIAILLGAPLPGQADLTLHGRSGIISMNRPSLGQETLYIRNQQLRRDLNHQGRGLTYLYDLGSREIVVIDHLMRQATRQAMAPPPPPSGPARGRARQDDGIQLDLKASGERRPLQGWQCAEQHLTARVPATLGQESATVVLEGTLWLAAKTREQAEFDRFLRALGNEDFFMGAPNLAGAQTLAINETLRRVLPRGVLCAADIEVRYEGGGRLAELGSRMATRVSLAWDRFSSEAVDASLFAIPAGYRVIGP